MANKEALPTSEGLTRALLLELPLRNYTRLLVPPAAHEEPEWQNASRREAAPPRPGAALPGGDEARYTGGTSADRSFSRNHRTSGVGRDLWGSASPTPFKS